MSFQNTRLSSLDAFRGATIVGMILVNSPGSYSYIYSQLQHAEWNGWTFADTIFPFFLFIMGVSMTFSFGSRIGRGDPSSSLLNQVVRRSLTLFGLGLFLNAFPIFHISSLRIPGVLQRISVCYFFASLILLRLNVKLQATCTIGLLVSYWLLMRLVPIPGLGAGLYIPGYNFAAYVDSIFLQGHMWSRTETWDPEGIVSTLPAISTTLFGVLIGHWLRSNNAKHKKTLCMLGFGALLVCLGELLGVWLPINKSIWTSSFALLMAGLATICLTLFYWLIDIRGYTTWAKPFTIYGMNAILAYVVSEVVDRALVFIRFDQGNGSDISLRSLIFRRLFRPLAAPEAASFLYAVSFVLLLYLLMWFMWKKRWFLKV